MLGFLTMRTVGAIGWLGIFAFLVLIPVQYFGLGLSRPTGIFSSLPGMLFTLVFAVSLFASALAFRIGSQRRSLEQLAISKAAPFSFSGSLDSASCRWLIHQIENRWLRWMGPTSVYVVATDNGLEIYWPLRLPTELLIHVIKWNEIADFSVRKRMWLTNEATVTCEGEQRPLRFRLAPTSLFSLGRQQGDDLQAAVRLRIGP